MTNPHPLTEKMINDIIVDVSNTDWNDCEDCEDTLLARAAYDLAIEHVYEIWDQLFVGVEKDSIVWLAFDRALEEMRPTREEQQVNEQITIEQALDLVEFKQYPDGTWFVYKVKSNCGEVEGNLGKVNGNCGRVGGVVYETINGRPWKYDERPETDNCEIEEITLEGALEVIKSESWPEVCWSTEDDLTYITINGRKWRLL